MCQKLSLGRINKQNLRIHLKASPLGAQALKTKLLKLDAPWPTIVLLSHNSPHIFISEPLCQKLNSRDQEILFAWCYEVFQQGLPDLGLKFCSYMGPLFKVTAAIDRISPRPWLATKTYRLAQIIYKPLTAAHNDIIRGLETIYSKHDLARLRHKLYSLVTSHNALPPPSMGFLLLDPNLPLGTLSSTDHQTKGILYGSPTTLGS